MGWHDTRALKMKPIGFKTLLPWTFDSRASQNNMTDNHVLCVSWSRCLMHAIWSLFLFFRTHCSCMVWQPFRSYQATLYPWTWFCPLHLSYTLFLCCLNARDGVKIIIVFSSLHTILPRLPQMLPHTCLLPDETLPLPYSSLWWLDIRLRLCIQVAKKICNFVVGKWHLTDPFLSLIFFWFLFGSLVHVQVPCTHSIHVSEFSGGRSLALLCLCFCCFHGTEQNL